MLPNACGSVELQRRARDAMHKERGQRHQAGPPLQAWPRGHRSHVLVQAAQKSGERER